MCTARQELNADIEHWTDTWNEDPKLYVWVKSAEEILDNLTGYCNTINASGLASTTSDP